MDNYQKLERLLVKTVHPYLSTSVLSLTKAKISNIDSDPIELQHQPKHFMVGNERLDPVIEVDVGSQRSSVSSISNESMTLAPPLLKVQNSEPGYPHSTPL